MTDQEFIAKLAQDLGINVSVSRNPYDAYSIPVDRAVFTVMPDNPRWYWSTLHEIGHVVDQPQADVRDRFAMMLGIATENVLESEARAWQWAVSNTHRPLDDEARAIIAYSLASYARGADRKDALRRGVFHQVAETVGPVNPSLSATAWAGSIKTDKDTASELDNIWREVLA